MPPKPIIFRAIDLYSGVGGWSLGLKMAGIEVVRSYEWWSPAAETQQLNLGDTSQEVDIRGLKMGDLPSDINLVVGSPPCTQFSYSNRGGGGDISDGLRDVYKFLEIVQHISPKYWLMENVPRVAGILERELSPGGELERFRKLVDNIEVVDCSAFGLPQRRKRMLAGRFPYERLASYQSGSPQRTLDQVIQALQKDTVEDPIYGSSIGARSLTDNDRENDLNVEEYRLNRDAKQFHRIYNIMPFPEPLERSARTITAAETRVSRESLIVGTSSERSKVRRLTLRERACLQGFPITYQFYGSSYSDRQKMIGNAIPPLLTYYMGRALQGVDSKIVHEQPKDYRHPLPAKLPSSIPNRSGVGRYRINRRFRSAIPNLRFGSGVRFELSNECIGGKVSWKIRFYFGSSKSYQSVEPNPVMTDSLVMKIDGVRTPVLHEQKNFIAKIDVATASGLQRVWNHRQHHGLGPFDVVDILGESAGNLIETLESTISIDTESTISSIISALNGHGPEYFEFGSNRKFKKIHLNVMAGIIAAGWFNALDLTGSISEVSLPAEVRKNR